MDTNTTTEVVGWVSSPDGRSTWQILTTNFLALFVCVWTVLHHNVQAPHDGYWTIVFRKFRWAVLAVAAPEMLTLFAIMQWNAANISMRQMQSLGIREHEWTQVHAFYANAGGKADRLAKWVAFLQAGWIIIQVISRAVQRLAITPLELFTSAFIVPSLATAYFWANKPQNVGEPTVIDVDWSIADLLVSAGDCAKEPYVDTPMDFIEKPPWDGWRRLPSLLHFGGLEKRPLERIPNDYSPPPPTGTEAMIVWVVSVIHATIHVIGWSFPFPTPIESIIWRASSLTLLFILAIGGLVPVLSTQPWFDFTFTLLWIWVRHAKKNTLMRRWCFKVVADISYAAYIVARLLLFAEIFAAFRALPADAYKDVEWSQFWPHGQ